MKKSSSENSRREATMAANLAARFAAGRNVLDYFDPARAVLTPPGGTNPGLHRAEQRCIDEPATMP